MYKSVFRDTFASVFEKKDELFKALLIPTLLLIFFHYFFIDIDKQFREGNINYFTAVPTFLLSLALNLTIAITTHRILLLGSDSVPKWGLFRLTSREWTFVYNFLLLVLLYLALTLALAAGSSLLFILVDSILGLNLETKNMIFVILPMIIIPIPILCGLALVFPSIAADKKLSFKEAWNLTKGYRVFCFVTIVVFPNIFAAIFGFVYGMVIEFLVRLISDGLTILYPILNVFISVFTISALSNTYKFIISNSSNKEEETSIDKPNKICKLSINDYDVINLDKNHDITFDKLKDDLILQYDKLGFKLTIIDETDSWVVKQEEDGDAYVALRVINDEYQIQTSNTEEPQLSILD